MAVALTDLAALYSERRRSASASFYERALRIQRRLGGRAPGHDADADGFSDLPPEQGITTWRPPLGALVLQEQTLGPEHADVAAIRDVLQSLDADDENSFERDEVI